MKSSFYSIFVCYLKKLKSQYPDKIIVVTYVVFHRAALVDQNDLQVEIKRVNAPESLACSLQAICMVKSIEATLFLYPTVKTATFWKYTKQCLYEVSDYAICYFYDLLLSGCERNLYMPIAQLAHVINLSNSDTKNRIVEIGRSLAHEKRKLFFLELANGKTFAQIAREQHCCSDTVHRHYYHARSCVREQLMKELKDFSANSKMTSVI